MIEVGEDGMLSAIPSRLRALPIVLRFGLLNAMTIEELRALHDQWPVWRHDGQMPPDEGWRVWLLMAGRGFGKTRAGAEWVSEMARRDGRAKIALVAATIDEVERVMIRGESGLMRVAAQDEDVIWIPSRKVVTFRSGAEAFAFSGRSPDMLRGPQHHFAWCDELAKWHHPEETWTNLLLGLRLGDDPRAVVTTTPRSHALLTSLADDMQTFVTNGRTADNPHLARDFAREMARRYGGTRLARQELEGELLADVEGALWPLALIERSRVAVVPALVRVVVGVDPPASAEGDACGIVAVGWGEDGVGYVIGDHTVSGLSPEGWAACVAAAAELHGADRVVAEKNQGGDMVESVLRAADVMLPVRLVHASRGKAVRAEPVAALFEAGRAKFVGVFAALEKELAGLSVGGGYAGPGRSPDRADAMVWAFTELMPKRKGRPRVRGFG